MCSLFGMYNLVPNLQLFQADPQDRLSNVKIIVIKVRVLDIATAASMPDLPGWQEGIRRFREHKDHIRRFFEHKLNIDTQRYGVSSCVGCGRCIQTCPGISA